MQVQAIVSNIVEMLYLIVIRFFSSLLLDIPNLSYGNISMGSGPFQYTMSFTSTSMNDSFPFNHCRSGWFKTIFI